MAESTHLKLLHIKGSHRQMGRQIGEGCPEEIHRMLTSYQRGFEVAFDEIQLTWDEALLQSRKYFPFAEEYTPQYVEELRGIAEASEVSFEDLMVLNCMEAITSDTLHLGCSSIAVSGEHTADGHVLVGHNEDWLPEDEANTFLVHAQPEDEPPFIAMTYGGLLPNIGFNALGLAQCLDSVYPNDARVGVPRIFVSRAVLGAKRIGEAIRAAIIKHRAAGYNHLIVDKSGEMYNVEVSSRQFATIYGSKGYLAHTNNYLTTRMKSLEDKTEDLIGSRVRVNRASRLLRKTGLHTPETFQSILADHVNHPRSICNHSVPEDSPLDRQKTICSMVMDLTALQMHFCWGSPCDNDYQVYPLEV